MNDVILLFNILQNFPPNFLKTER